MHLFQNRYLLERKSHVLMLFCPTFHNISVYRSNSFTHLSQMIFESFLLLLLMFSLRVILTKNRGTFLLMVSMRLGRQKCQEKVGQSATFSVGSGHTKKWAIKCVNFQPSSRVLWKLLGWCGNFELSSQQQPQSSLNHLEIYELYQYFNYLSSVGLKSV